MVPEFWELDLNTSRSHESTRAFYVLLEVRDYDPGVSETQCPRTFNHWHGCSPGWCSDGFQTVYDWIMVCFSDLNPEVLELDLHISKVTQIDLIKFWRSRKSTRTFQWRCPAFINGPWSYTSDFRTSGTDKEFLKFDPNISNVIKVDPDISEVMRFDPTIPEVMMFDPNISEVMKFDPNISEVTPSLGISGTVTYDVHDGNGGNKWFLSLGA